MPFEVGNTINSFADSILQSPFISAVARNPIYTALLITIIIILILIFVFRDVDSDESLLTMALRTGFWVFILLLGSLFMQNKILLQETYTEDKHQEINQMFDKIGSGIEYDEPLMPIFNTP